MKSIGMSGPCRSNAFRFGVVEARITSGDSLAIRSLGIVTVHQHADAPKTARLVGARREPPVATPNPAMRSRHHINKSALRPRAYSDPGCVETKS
jgi:hypothetical protein